LFRSTDINNIKDEGNYYHMEFDMYDHENLFPARFSITTNMFEKIGYNYMVFDLDKNVNSGIINNCVFFMDANLSFDSNKFHLKIPKSFNEKVISTIEKNYNSEVYIEGMGDDRYSLVCRRTNSLCRGRN
jgi:hypothetical protein